MSTRVVDRYGEPFPTEDVRRRLGFLGGDLLPVDSGGEVNIPEPRGERGLFHTDHSEGGWNPAECRKRGRA